MTEDIQSRRRNRRLRNWFIGRVKLKHNWDDPRLIRMFFLKRIEDFGAVISLSIIAIFIRIKLYSPSMYFSARLHL